MRIICKNDNKLNSCVLISNIYKYTNNYILRKIDAISLTKAKFEVCKVLRLLKRREK